MTEQTRRPGVLMRLYWRIFYGKDEWLDLVDPEGRILGRAPRTVCHRKSGKTAGGNPGNRYLHQVVHLHVTDPSGNLYMQKRAMTREIEPGKWDTSVGGHVLSGETVEEALVRETREELGLRDFVPRSLLRYIWESDREYELVNVFTVRTGQTPVPDPEETDGGRFWTATEIREGLESGLFTPNFVQEYPRIRESLEEKRS